MKQVLSAALLFALIFLIWSAEAPAKTISASSARQVALSFAPAGSRATQTTSAQSLAMGARTYSVYYPKTSRMSITPEWGHTLIINSLNQVILSYYLDGQIIYNRGGTLPNISAPLRDNQPLSPTDDLAARFANRLGALTLPIQMPSSLTKPLPIESGDQISSGSDSVDGYGQDVEPGFAPDIRAGVASSGSYSTIRRLIYQTLGVRETCGNNCGRDIFVFTGNRREAWCAWYVSWLVRRSGAARGASLPWTGQVSRLRSWGQDWQTYHSSASQARRGAFVIFPGDTHVGIYMGRTRRGNIIVAAGNTGVSGGVDGVAIKAYSPGSIAGYVNMPR